MAFHERGHDKVRLLCLSNLRWCVIGWPLRSGSDEGHWILDPSAQATVIFMTAMNQYLCSVVKPEINQKSKRLEVSCDQFQPALRCCLESFSSELVHHQLIFIAQLCGLQVSSGKSRADVLTALALHVGDQAFAEQIVNSDAKCNKKEPKRSDDDELAEHILDTMDKEELSDFKDILKRVSAKVAKKKKWQAMLQKHLEVTHMNI